MTPGLRRAMTCAYMPDGCTFNGQTNVLPDRPEIHGMIARVPHLIKVEEVNE